jgi:hypothetical protein
MFEFVYVKIKQRFDFTKTYWKIFSEDSGPGSELRNLICPV